MQRIGWHMTKYNLKPNALDDLGEDTFVKVPLYQSKIKYEAKYINTELFKKYFNDSNVNFEHMSKVISNEFSTTIDKKKSNGKIIGYAYIDKQYDPLKISMSGNLGSGRAYYQGDVFNIKGEKTPLAISEREEYSNGVLEFEKSIFETVASNSLYNDTSIKLSPILAILDIKEPCKVSWKKKTCKRAKIIRINIDGSLNRITHIFQGKKQLSANEIKNTAKAFGEQEGEKFLQRIEHGAWSAGNISSKAHMIDFDTVCAVKYRAPQFSFCIWFFENYFGYEHYGQAKILKSLANSKEINIENVSYKELSKIMFKARENYILNNFSKLMGFNYIDKKHLKSIKKLYKLFDELSRKCYPNPEFLSCKQVECYENSPFNFSRFFRLFPILKHRTNFEIFEAYNILTEQLCQFNDFDIKNFDRTNKNNKFYYNHVLQKINKNFIHSFDEYLKLSKKCILFIELYNKFYEKLLNDKTINKNEIELNAYKYNEDRKYLFMPNTIGGFLDKKANEYTSYQMHRAISLGIFSNKRNIEHKFLNLTPADVTILNEGFFAVLLNKNGQHKLSLNLYKDMLDINENDFFEIKINNKKYAVNKVEINEIISIQTDFIDNHMLLPNFYKKIFFYKNNKKISLKKNNIKLSNFANTFI